MPRRDTRHATSEREHQMSEDDSQTKRGRPRNPDHPAANERTRQRGRGGAADLLPFESFDPAHVRPWRFHNRAGSGMDDAALDALAASIQRDGQQQLGLARRLPAGDTHAVEAIFGVRRLEAGRRAGGRAVAGGGARAVVLRPFGQARRSALCPGVVHRARQGVPA